MLPDKVEAAVRAGRPEVAREALRLFEAWATHSGARFAAPRLAGCRALLAEGDEATEHFEAMLALADDARPLDLARMRMQYGEHLRRERRRTDARTQFRAALATFEAYRSEPLAERARAELRATGETARKRDPSTIDQLTPQELQIARFVAERAVEQGGRGAAVPVAADRRRAPAQGVHEARHHLAHAARAAAARRAGGARRAGARLGEVRRFHRFDVRGASVASPA